MGGFFDILGLGGLSARRDLTDEQKTLGGEPVVTLVIGAHTLSAFLWGYKFEEESGKEQGLTLWLDNRGGEFDDLAGDYPDLVRGAAIDLQRGLPVPDLGDVVKKLPDTWIEGWEYEFVDGAALLRLDCIDWRGKLGRFRYSSQQRWAATEAATIAASILGEVGLTLAAGTFGFTTDFGVSSRRDGVDGLDDLMKRVDEYLYSGDDGEILHKELDPDEAAGYSYDWTAGGDPAVNHPVLRESGAVAARTRSAASSPRYNKVAVVGGSNGEYSGSDEDATEIALVGTRLRTLFDDDLSSDAQCAERAQAELRYWQAQATSGLIIARPHFTLRLYDVVSLGEAPWGGPALTGRVMGYVEEYGRGRGIWEQRITLGGVAWRGIAPGLLRDGAITGLHVDSQPVAAGSYKIREGDGSEILLALTAEEDAGIGTTATQEIRGKDATSREGYFEIIAVTDDGVAHDGVASVVISLDTGNGVIEFTGALRVRMGTTYLEMTEQAADPDAPGVNRGRVYMRDSGAGKTQMCVRFNTGVIQVVAAEP